LAGAIYAFDLGGGEGITPKVPERDILGSDTYSQEFHDD